jgi:hypothetical protein
MARIETTPAVRFALYVLRIYLVILLLLIVVKFLRIFPLTPHPPRKAAVMSVSPVGERCDIRAGHHSIRFG